jgi:hypothetical protein
VLLQHCLPELAQDFALAPGFLETMRFGTLQINSDLQLSMVALRMTVNQKSSVLHASLPIADLEQPQAASALFFQMADGGGYITTKDPFEPRSPGI